MVAVIFEQNFVLKWNTKNVPDRRSGKSREERSGNVWGSGQGPAQGDRAKRSTTAGVWRA